MIKITVKYKINKDIICSEIGTPLGIRIIITIGEVKGIIEKMTEIILIHLFTGFRTSLSD